jgi:ABC-type lipopolysaccharide export system ATPase subunit
MYRRARDGGMGYLPQESSVFSKLTLQQNLIGVMELLGKGRRERRSRCDELLRQFRITGSFLSRHDVHALTLPLVNQFLLIESTWPAKDRLPDLEGIDQ